MKYRPLGATGLQISEIGFGCGNTAGLLTQGTWDQKREAVGRALELGINYFDTAPNYGVRVGGVGVSARHLGQALRELGGRPIIGTKVEFWPEDLADIPGTIHRSLEESLARLGLDTVDILYLHNSVAHQRSLGGSAIGSRLSIEDVLGAGGVAQSFEQLRGQGKVRWLAFCSSGSEPSAVHEVIASGRFHCVQLSYNILNPTEGRSPPDGFQGPDYGDTIRHAFARGMGAVAIRVLAAGALSGLAERHPLSEGSPGQATQYAADEERAHTLRFLTETSDQTMAQAAIRFALANEGVSCALVGFSTMEQVEEAVKASELGGLPEGDLSRIDSLYRSDFQLKKEETGRG